MKYRNKKTGKIYNHVTSAIDCTNNRSETRVIVYSPEDDESIVYVRDEKEFIKKFDTIEENGV